MNKYLIFLFGVLISYSAQAQRKKLPVLKTDKNRLTLIIDSVSYGEVVELNPKIRPDLWNFPVKKKVMNLIFKSSVDSLEIDLKGGKKADFIVLISGGKDTAFLRAVGQKFTNPANFNKSYRRANNLKTTVEIPAVYELTNIIIALTPSAAKNRDLAFRNSEYYKTVMETFGPFKDEIIVKKIDSLIKDNKYAHLKMDSYSFEMHNGKIVKSKVYDRISWGALNTLRPFAKELQNFANKTNFYSFYQTNNRLYNDQIRCYSDSVKLAQIVSWLRKNYPTTDYNSFKVIFSPLVSGNQSANFFENNNFKEAQAHVNFPYIRNSNNQKLSADAINLNRGSIVFTELNHCFNDPETAKHQSSANFILAFSNLETWLEKGKPASSYNNSLACFNEYMNWGLVSLYFVDFAPASKKEQLISSIENNMKNYRGFKRFPEFNQFLVSLYKSKREKPLADYYSEIIHWFATHKG